MRIADGQGLVAEKVRRKKAQRSGERPLEVVLVVEVPAAEMIILADGVIEPGEVLRAVDVVVGVELKRVKVAICVLPSEPASTAADTACSLQPRAGPWAARKVV